MVGHIDVRDVDAGVPSSLSPKVVGLLRTELGSDGLVVTDAQNMAAITAAYGAGTRSFARSEPVPTSSSCLPTSARPTSQSSRRCRRVG
jgi:hypothetical protein